jgi:hypothetical protein
MSSFEAKKVLKDEGIILELYLPSMISRGEVRSFEVLSAKGLKYGNNDKNPLHPLETKISWKLDMFEEIANILNESVEDRVEDLLKQCKNLALKKVDNDYNRLYTLDTQTILKEVLSGRSIPTECSQSVILKLNYWIHGSR